MRHVRNLDILMFDSIQKITHNKLVAYMCTGAILSLLGLEINITITVDILKIKYSCLELYQEEGPVPKTLEAPFALINIVRCLK